MSREQKSVWFNHAREIGFWSEMYLKGYIKVGVGKEAVNIVGGV